MSERWNNTRNLLKDWIFNDLDLGYEVSESDFNREAWWWSSFELPEDLYNSLSNIPDVSSLSIKSVLFETADSCNNV